MLQNTHRESLDLPDLALSMLPVTGEGVTQFELVLSATEAPMGIAFNLSYSTDLFDPPTIERLLGCFREVLIELPGDLDRPLAALPPLREAERHQVLAGKPGAASGPSVAERRSRLSARREQLSDGRRALLRKWLQGSAED